MSEHTTEVERCITMNLEDFDQVIGELEPYARAEWEEVSIWKDKIKWAPRWDAYSKMAEQDLLRLFVVRENDEIIGYAVFMLMVHPIHGDDKFAINDAVYLVPHRRHGILTPALFQAVEETLRSDGVSVITYHMKVHATFSKLMSALGYTPMETMYAKVTRE